MRIKDGICFGVKQLNTPYQLWFKFMLLVGVLLIPFSSVYAANWSCHSRGGGSGKFLQVAVVSPDGTGAGTLRTYRVVPLNEKVADFLVEVKNIVSKGTYFPNLICVKGTIGGPVKEGSVETNEPYLVYDIRKSSYGEQETEVLENR